MGRQQSFRNRRALILGGTFLQLEAKTCEIAAHSYRYLLFGHRSSSKRAAQGRYQSAGSGKAESADGLQICRNGSGYKAVGRCLRGIGA